MAKTQDCAARSAIFLAAIPSMLRVRTWSARKRRRRFSSNPSAGKRIAYVPAIGSLSDTLLAKIDQADLLLFDGTFWSDDELIRVQGSGETAHEMGHIPVEESLRLLKNIKSRAQDVYSSQQYESDAE